MKNIVEQFSARSFERAAELVFFSSGLVTTEQARDVAKAVISETPSVRLKRAVSVKQKSAAENTVDEYLSKSHWNTPSPEVVPC